MKSQLAKEEETSRTNSWFISDRSGLDPIIYAQRHVSAQFAEQMMALEEWQQLRDRLAKSLIFVCEIRSEWLSNDGVRLMPLDGEDWQRYHEMFCSRLEALNIEYYVVPSAMSDLRERVSYVWCKWRIAMGEPVATK
jgi:hypothetical protein